MGSTKVAHILGVHPRTVERRRSAEKRLSLLGVQREGKLHRVWEELLRIYSPDRAVRWLNSEVPALGRRRPLEVMAEDGGLDQVLQTVGRMSWGIPD